MTIEDGEHEQETLLGWILQPKTVMLSIGSVLTCEGGRMNDKELNEVKKIIQEHLPIGEVKVFDSDDGVVMCFIIPEKGPLTRRNMVMTSINRSGVMDKFQLGDFAVLEYESEEKRVVTRVAEFVRKATRSAQIFCGDYHTEVEVALRGNILSIEISNFNIQKKGARDRFNECIKEVYGDLKSIAGTEQISVSISGGVTMYSDIMHSYPNDDYDDDPVNPNWPSKTGNPSGPGRGNNPPGSKR
ncbi:hypothetical protein IEI94_18770 [Halomonas sp. ML-15]|uniref:hypothetical protein n=1 Tax=Halomonas sp. ML-15 TaxID=2773305 RepID=UPI001746C278|nr:hypothetical protein [Halomonas sp. ML-15]MBD3897904.1 hypothetical protein [Halomonas sp. ML-15]